MKSNSLSLITILKSLACMALLVGFSAQGADKNVDPTGKWTWSREGRDGGPARTTTLTLKLDGDKLTGKIATPGRQGGAARETDIEKGMVKGNEVSFVVVREFNDNKFVTNYKGKIEGDEMKGTMEFNRGGQSRSRDWVAKRSK